jgi:alpha-L-rhamnosidase
VNETKSNGDNMVSFNHYSFGSVGKFYYQYILGIQPMEPGFAKIKIQPRIDSRIGTFSGSYKDILVAYDGKTLHISTPADTQIILPDGTVHEVGAGTYDFSVKEQ